MALRTVAFAITPMVVVAQRFGGISSGWSNFENAALDNPWSYRGITSSNPSPPVHAQVQLDNGPVLSQTSEYGPMWSLNGVVYTQAYTVQAHVVAR